MNIISLTYLNAPMPDSGNSLFCGVPLKEARAS